MTRAALTLGFVLLAVTACSAPAWALGTDRYDAAIEDASARWLPGWDWRRYRAQLYQESRLDPDARSPVGAGGIAQFMPGTWPAVAEALGYGHLSPYHAAPAIDAGAYYLARQMRIWTEPRPDIERRRLAEAGYNAGSGNIIAAQRVCRQHCTPCRDWSQIAAYLHHVTGQHADETRTYIQRIERWYRVMQVAR